MESGRQGPPYHRVWAALFLGWVVSYVDRSLTGPVVTWMIDSDVAFLQGVNNPHAFGGLLGSLFFAGYMLTQFPGGYFGDKYGHRLVVIISIFWAATTTLLTGLIGGLFFFVAFRILTGLGEGAFYSNDRALIAQATPRDKMGLGMGLVISGLTIGLTIALIAVPPLIRVSFPFMGEDSWRAPFILMSIPTFLVGWVMLYLLRSTIRREEKAGVAIRGLAGYSAVFFVAIMTVFYLTDRAGLSPVGTALILTGLAMVLLIYIYSKKTMEIGPVLFNRNLLLIYLSAVPVLWHLWFYGYWSVAVVESVGSTFMVAALTASFYAIAGLIGFPVGGMVSDWAVERSGKRRGVLAALTACVAVMSVAFGAYIMVGGADVAVMSILLFVSGLFFFALQPVSHALTAELAPDTHRGAAFGMWNLIAEIGALLAPVISGAVRDATEGWGWAIILDAALMAISCMLVLGIRAESDSTS